MHHRGYVVEELAHGDRLPLQGKVPGLELSEREEVGHESAEAIDFERHGSQEVVAHLGVLGSAAVSSSRRPLSAAIGVRIS